MTGLADLLSQHARDLAITASVAIACAAVLLWLRRTAGRWIARLAARAGRGSIAGALRRLLRPALIWIVLISALAALEVAPLVHGVQANAGRAVLAVLVVAIAVSGIRFVRDVAFVVGEHVHAPAAAERAVAAIGGTLVGLVAALIVLQVWGVATAPVLVLVTLAAILALVALRDVLPALVAAFQVAAIERIEVGSYLSLDSGEEGTVEDVGWRAVVLRRLDGSRVEVPHAKLVRSTRVRRRPPPRRAVRPMRFVERSHLRELTGQSARTLGELAECVRQAPDAAIYYHTHQYLEEHEYLEPTPTNELAEWVGGALGLASVAEALGAVDILEVAGLAQVRERLLAILDEAIAAGLDTRSAAPGQELHILKSITVVTPCPYTASNRLELAGVVRRLSHGSLFFHLFEARLIGGDDAERDLATWIRRQLDEPELAAEIGRLNPYDYTLDNLRRRLVRWLEAGA